MATLIIHAGTNNVEQNSTDHISTNSEQLVDTLQQKFRFKNVAFSSVVKRKDKLFLNEKN